MSPLYRPERIGPLQIEPIAPKPSTTDLLRLRLPITGPPGNQRGEGELGRQELEQLRDAITEALE